MADKDPPGCPDWDLVIIDNIERLSSIDSSMSVTSSSIDKEVGYRSFGWNFTSFNHLLEVFERK